MAYKVIWTETAQTDLHEIVEYIAKENKVSAMAEMALRAAQAHMPEAL